MKTSIEIVDAIDKFSNGSLREKDSLEFLLRTAIENETMSLIDDVAFHSKFLWRLLSFFQSGRKFEEVDEEVYKSRIFELINESVEKIRNLILKIVSKAPQQERETFVSKFLEVNAQSFGNFVNLVHDFYWLKNWKIDNEV